MWIVINVNCKFNNFQYKDEFFLCNSCVMVFDLIVQLDKIFESWFIWVVCKSLQILIGFCLWEWWIGNYKKWLWMNYCSLFCDCSRVAALPLSQSLLRCNRIPRFAWLLLSDFLYHFASKVIDCFCYLRKPQPAWAQTLPVLHATIAQKIYVGNFYSKIVAPFGGTPLA